MRILILGGTSEARALAGRLLALGHDVVTSLAGRTQQPLRPAGALRVGRFGGAAGLVAYLGAARIERLVDATHPYAELISRNAEAAAAETGVPLLRYLRPAWVEPAGAGWRHVADLAGAAAALPRGARVLVTTGHEGLKTLLARDDCRFVVRLIEAPEPPLPTAARLLLTRPPHGLADELALFAGEGITHLVTKNSGGTQTAAKLEAARQAGAEVVMIARPAYGPAREAAAVAEAVAAVLGR